MTTRKKINPLTNLLKITAFLSLNSMVFVPTQPASAIPNIIPSATDCSIWKTITVPLTGVVIPKSWLCFTVYGSGTSISSMVATWRAPSLCNWRIDWVIYYQGKVWWKDKGSANGCTSITGGRSRGAGAAPAGSSLCAELYSTSHNKKLDDICFGIDN
jgi:hypothetical protein